MARETSTRKRGACMTWLGVTLGTWILIVSTLLYVGAGIAFAYEGKVGLSVAYVAYAVANIGLMIVAIQGT